MKSARQGKELDILHGLSRFLTFTNLPGVPAPWSTNAPGKRVRAFRYDTRRAKRRRLGASPTARSLPQLTAQRIRLGLEAPPDEDRQP
jgi:hypothetical protein